MDGTTEAHESTMNTFDVYRENACAEWQGKTTWWNQIFFTVSCNSFSNFSKISKCFSNDCCKWF